jgi:RHS repeat-associated protein
VQALNRWRDLAHHFLGTRLSRLFLLLVAGFLSTGTAIAQNGNVAYPENAIDSRMRTSMRVDPTSGALQFQITLGNYPGRAGAGMPIILNYSSKLWRVEHVSTMGGCDQWGHCYPQDSDYAAYFAESSAAGWTSNLDWFIWPSGESPIQSYDGLGRPADNTGQWYAARMFVRLPDGSKHELRRDDNVWSGFQSSGVFYAVDGSRLRYHTDTQTLWLPDGSRYVGNTQYIDRNGNTLTYNGAFWTDTLGRAIGLPLPAFSTTGEQSQAAARDEYYSIPGVGGVSLTYTFKWRYLTDVRTDPSQALRPKGDRLNVYNCQRVPSLFTSPSLCGGLDEDHRIISPELFNPVVLHQIVLPNGSAYTFTYNIYGEIDKVIYPTGGHEKFIHGQAPELSANFTSDQIGNFYAQANRGVYEQRISADGTEGSEVLWQYSLGPVNWTTAPDGTRTERRVHQSQGQLIAYGFDDPRAGLAYDERVSAPNNGPMLRRKLTEWIVDGTVQYVGPRLMYKTRNPRPVKEVEIILDTGGNALAATTTYQYDADLNVISIRQYAFVEVNQTTAQTEALSAIPTGSLIRTEETDYLTNNQAYRDRNMLSLPTATRVKDAGETIIAQSQILYDEGAYPLLLCGAVAGWSDPATSARGNATTARSWLNTTGGWVETHAQFDQCGSGRKSWDGKGNVTEVQYSGAYQSAYPTSTISAVPDPAGQTGSSTSLTTNTSYDFYTGLVTSATDQNNQTTTLEYASTDALGNANPLQRLTRATRPDGGWTAYGYSDQPGSLFVLARAALDSSRYIDSSKYFDGLGRPHRTYLNEGGGNYVVTDMQYDSLGRVWKVSNPYRTTTLNGAINPSGLWTTTAYDPLGRALTVTTPDNASVKTAYSGNRVLVADQNTSDDLRRKRISETDALGRLKTVWEVTAADQYTEDVSFPNWPSVTKGYKTTYQYDALDNLTQVSQGGQPARMFAYDSLKRLLSANNLESGTISYQYDNNGTLTQKTDARGVVSTYAYDALNRNTSISYSDGTPSVGRAYDGAINGKGRFWYHWTSAADTSKNTHTAIDVYDAVWRVKNWRQHFWVNGNWSQPPYSMAANYDLAGHVTSVTYPSGRTVTNTYDNAGRLSSFSGNLGDGTLLTYASGISYSSFGGPAQEQFGTNTPLYHKQHYNVRGQLYDVRVSTASIQSDKWNYNRGALSFYYGGAAWGQSSTTNNGNVTMQQHFVPLNDAVTDRWYSQDTYAYDSLNRLTSVSEAHGGMGGVGSTDFVQAYTYDRWGNRTIDQVNTTSNVPKPNFGVDQNTNRLTAPGGYSMSYDQAGNLTFDNYAGEGTRTYDAENRMIGAQASLPASYRYDADGHRVKRIIGSTETWQVYGIGGELLAEYAANSAASNPHKEYGYRNGELLITAEATSSGSGGETQNVAWTNAVGVSVNGNNLTKSATQGWGNAGAASTQSINSGDGYAEFSSSGITLFGLSHTDPDQSYTSIEFGVHVTGNDLYVYESGTQRGYFGNVAPTDRLRVGVEGGVVKYKKNGTVFYTSTVAPTYPLLVDTALYTNGSTISNVVVTLNGLQNVSWTNTGGVSATGNNLTKTAAEGWGNSGAASNETIASGDGYAEFSASNLTLFGLSHADTDQNYTSIEFGLHIAYDGSLYVFESGANRGWVGTVTSSDRLRISVEGGVVKYRKNGTLLYTSTGPPTYPLLVDTALYTNGSTISNVVVTLSGPQDVSWTNPAGVTATGNNLTKTAAEGWGNSGAASTQSIISGDGYAEFSASGVTLFGLSHTDSDQDYASIEFGWHINSGNLYVFESGLNRGQVGTVTSSDRLRVSVEAGVVKYRKNGVLLYTSTVAPTYPLLVDSALYSNGATLTNVVMSGGGGGGGGSSANIHWLVTDHLGTPRMIFDQSGSLANVSRHDYLPFGEELFAGTGGRTTAQGYTASDGVRQKFTQKERDTETGLDYFGARYFSSIQGRFTSFDPLLSSGMPQEPQSWNRYSYTINNPLKYIDPTGLIWVYQDSPGVRTFRWYDNEKDVPTGWTIFTESYYDGADGRYYFNPEGPKGYFEGPSQRNGLFAINLDKWDVEGWVKGPTPEQYKRYMMSGAVEDQTWDIIGLLIPGNIGRKAIAGSLTARATAEAAEAIPRATNARLQRTIDDLFQPTDRIPGGTAGAVRYELRTGERVGGTFHSGKAQNSINRIRNILREEKLSPADRGTAQRLMHDLQNALKGK